MTEERAIEILKQRECCRECVADCSCDECDNAFDMAIKVLEKDTPKAPKKSKTPRSGMGYDYYDWCCPSCGKFLAYECDSEREKIHHCICGQRLKWESEE